MRDALGPGTLLGYCTNVHAGVTLAEVRANLDRYATAVAARLGLGDEPLGIGLWLAEPAARALAADAGDLAAFRRWLDARRLNVFTINGFPQRDFHRGVVKHAVYAPDWSDPARLAYTRDLITVIAALRAGRDDDPRLEGSISTLPVGWPRPDGADGEEAARLRAAATHLVEAARCAAQAAEEHGVHVHVDLEPEPGCVLQRAGDVVRFFADHIDVAANGDGRARSHLGVCHDVCHASVMFEGQDACFDRYAEAGIAVGKVQLSSALAVHFDAMDDAARRAARAELAAFGEDRYLHQTVVERRGVRTFDEDLPTALASAAAAPSGEWRIHYHVPLFAAEMGVLSTTQRDLGSALRRAARVCRHFEVETYAWTVLPARLRAADLAEGIAREVAWVRDLAARTPEAGGGP